ASADILNKDSVSMGKIQSSGLFEAAAGPVFTLKEGGVTDPIQSPFGWHIFRVTAIYPASTASFDEMRPTLEKDLKQHAGDDALNKLANTLEDDLAGGNGLQNTARELGLKVTTLPAINRQGETAEGGKPQAVPSFDKFIDTVFKTDEKTDSPLMT